MDRRKSFPILAVAAVGALGAALAAVAAGSQVPDFALVPLAAAGFAGACAFGRRSALAAKPAGSPLSVHRGHPHAQTEENYLRLIEATPFAIRIFDPDGRVAFANQAAAHLYAAASPAHLVGRRRHEMVSPEWRAGAEEAHRRVLGGETIRRPGVQHLRLDGSVFDAEVTLLPLVWNGAPSLLVITRDVTAQQRAEAELRDSEERFRKLAEVSFEAVVISENGVCTAAFGRTEDVYGYGPTEMISRNLAETVAPEGRGEAARRTVNQIDGMYETAIRRRDGRTVPVEISAGHYRRGDRSVRVAAIRDLSERRAAEIELRQSEERLRNLAAAAFDMVMLIADGRYEAVFGNVKELCGHEPADFIGRPAGLLAVPEDREGSMARISDGVEGRFEIEIRHKDGRNIPVEMTSKRFPRDGRLLRVVGLRDVTARKRAEEKLRDSEERFRRLVRNVPGMVFQRVLPPGGPLRFTYVSDGVRDLTGFGPEEVLNSFSVLSTSIHPEDRETYHRALDVSARTLEPMVVDLRHALFGGRMKWMRNISRPTRLEDGTIVWDGIAIDITDRKDAEAALEGAKAELETARRAAETAQREAESASRAKSDFLATMSHEIRTPMNGVLGMASVLQDTPLTEQQRIYVTTIRQSGEALLAIINDILDFSKMEAGRIDLEPVEFDVGEMLDSIFRLLGPAARDKGLDMPAFVAPDVPRKLVGDVGRLRQIVLNLLGNGLKFTESGAVAVEISLAARDERGVTLRCEVTDTGIGIEPEVREALFTRFSQGDSSTTRRFGGTGLGLAICKQLVQLMRGEIRVDSTPGKGSRFWFTVRLGEAGAAGEASPLRGWRILVAESEELCRRVLRRQLEAWGANVAEVADGAEAERVVAVAPERVDAQRSDIVLCDSRLPDIGGLDLARRLRHRAPDGFGRFILMSKIAADDLGSALANFGVDDYLTKPFTPAALRDCLSRLAPDGPAAEPRRKLGSPAARGGPALVAETADERTAGATSRR